MLVQPGLLEKYRIFDALSAPTMDSIPLIEETIGSNDIPNFLSLLEQARKEDPLIDNGSETDTKCLITSPIGFIAQVCYLYERLSGTFLLSEDEVDLENALTAAYYVYTIHKKLFTDHERKYAEIFEKTSEKLSSMSMSAINLLKRHGYYPVTLD